MTSYRASLLIALVSVFGFVGPAQSESVTVTKAVQDSCEWDYNQFCNQYGLGSELLDMCFKSNGPKLSKACVDALIAAGDISQEDVDRERASGPLRSAHRHSDKRHRECHRDREESI